MLKRVKYLPSDHNYEAFGESVLETGVLGWFHGWVNDVDEFDGQMMYVPRAIVQGDSGKIDLVFPTEIVFLDTPLDYLITEMIAALSADRPAEEIVKRLNGIYKA
jgi:hypothetical protein